jgi:hypothetical protein
LILLSQGWGWLIPWAWAFTVVAVFLRLSKSTSAKRIASILFVGAVTVSYSFADRLRSEQWWAFRFQALPDPDVQFVASSANSVGLFGWSDNIFFGGYRYSYHIFSFAWINGTSGGLGLGPFEFSAVVANVYLAAIFTLLTFGIIFQYGQRSQAAWAVTIIIASFWADPVPLLQVWNPFSLSHNYSVILFFAVVALFTSPSDKRSWLLIALLSTTAVLSKASMLITLGMLLVSAFLFWRSKVDDPRTLTVGALGTLAVVAAVFVFHYQPLAVLEEASTVVSPSLSVGGVLGSRGFGPEADSVFGSIVIAIVFGLFLYVCFYAPSRERSNNIQKYAVVSSITLSSLGTLAAGLILSDESQSSNYYIAVAVGALTLGLGIRAAESIFDLKKMASRRNLVILGFCLAGLILVDLVGQDSWIFVACLFVLTCAAVFADRKSVSLRRGELQLLLLMSIAIFALAIPAWKKISDSYSTRNVTFADYELPGGGPNLREVLLWVRDNTPRDSVVLNSRLCNFGYDRVNNGRKNEYHFGAECYRGWSLTSAITARRNFFEGHYPLVPLISERDRAERYALADAFLSNPNAATATALNKAGVDFVIMETEMTGMSEVGTYPGVVFRAAGGYVVQLSNTLGLAD